MKDSPMRNQRNQSRIPVVTDNTEQEVPGYHLGGNCKKGRVRGATGCAEWPGEGGPAGLKVTGDYGRTRSGGVDSWASGVSGTGARGEWLLERGVQ